MELKYGLNILYFYLLYIWLFSQNLFLMMLDSLEIRDREKEKQDSQFLPPNSSSPLSKIWENWKKFESLYYNFVLSTISLKLLILCI